jgi:hypothetical protein
MPVSVNDTDNPKRQLLTELCRHIVCLNWVDITTGRPEDSESHGERDPQAVTVSAFVISVRAIWFLVTAGHVIREIRTRLAKGRRIVTARLMDGFSTQQSLPPIPFPLADTLQSHINKGGFDYALIPLRRAYVRLLMAGGVLALDEETWSDPPDSADAYFLLGFPQSAVTTRVTEGAGQCNVSLGVGTPLLRVKPVHNLDEVPEDMRYAPNRFFGRVPIPTREGGGEDPSLNSIKGMSGGPLFAVRFEGLHSLRYWVIAVQSAWAEASRVIAACPIQPLADAVAKSIDDHAAELDGHEVKEAKGPNRA